jgi:asparagine synthase (glutamine-hydrolysing)
MCGICGRYNFGDDAPVGCRDIARMTRTLVHRGPDDEGYHLDGSLGLGFRRLSIIDLAGGHQPMTDSEESVWVAFNGEIYNFRELREQLVAHGHRFRTTSDTEVIVYGYRQWGDAVLDRLNGMFGLAIWDARRRRLLLARDPFGIKLVYYRLDGARLAFGSEIRAVLAATGEAAAVDPVALNLFLRYRYTPSPHTLFAGIRKLAPGTKLVVENGQARVCRWYRSRPTPFVPPKSPGEATEELGELYRRAVRRHLVSDVPVGLLLSGGADSALLLALMNLDGSAWPAYTVGYGASFADDELADAAETARQLSARHATITVTRPEFENALARVVGTLEEPIASSSIVPMDFVCRRARQDVKVALVGQGPDELFGGYRRHLGVRYRGAWARLPGWVRRPTAAAVQALPRSETAKRAVYALAIPDRLRRYQHVLSILPGPDVDGLFRDGMLPPGAGDGILDTWADLEELMSDTDELGGFQFVEIRSTLPDELLMYADKLSMAHGLELRVPYLDREVVEYVERLPASLKVRHGVRKWLHRRVCETYLPRAVVRRPKRGFAVNVVDDWFRHALDGRMADMLRDGASRMYRYLRQPAVMDLVARHQAGRSDNHKILFSLVVFEEWLRAHAS